MCLAVGNLFDDVVLELEYRRGDPQTLVVVQRLHVPNSRGDVLMAADGALIACGGTVLVKLRLVVVRAGQHRRVGQLQRTVLGGVGRHDVPPGHEAVSHPSSFLAPRRG